MKCEEFEMAGLDLGAAGAGSPLQVAAREHLRECLHCAALHEQWQSLQEDLQSLRAETQDAGTPSRVEMRLRQEFRAKHKTLRARRAAVLTAWALATAAVLVGAITWINWRQDLHRVVAVRQNTAKPSAVGNVGSEQSSNSGQSLNNGAQRGPKLGEVAVASNDAGEFTFLPGTIPGTLDDATVMRVQMRRGALGSLGFTVNEERAGDWIQVDLLVGNDGLPQAVRLPQTTD
jgi:hypothetical protein